MFVWKQQCGCFSVHFCVFLLVFSQKAEKTSVQLSNWVKTLTVWLYHNRLLHPLYTETKALIKTAKYGISFLLLKEHRASQKGPPDATLAVTGNRKYLLPPGSQSQPSDYYTICSLAHTLVEARCSMMSVSDTVCSLGMRWLKVTEI